MRILVLQLARFGDIYQTWPTLSALKRQHPEAELHVLVRHRFRQALEGRTDLVVHSWPTADILESIFKAGDEAAAHAKLLSVVQSLAELNFDRVINLSFSPVSSYLAPLIATPNAMVTGYSRHDDGFLNIPDDASAYFFAQGEIGKANRFHVTELFSLVAQCELTEADFAAITPVKPVSERRKQIILHLGASQVQRQYPPERWVAALRLALEKSEVPWILVGSPDEKALADTVCAQLQSPFVSNQVGQTNLPALMRLLADSQLLVGCDSAPAQMASLTQTPVLQLSSAFSNFWTTGPTSGGSRIIYEEELQSISPQRIAAEALAMVEGQGPTGPCALRESALKPYVLHDLKFDDFAWELIQALYTQSAYPETSSEADLLAFQRLFEIAELALQQLPNFQVPERRKTSALILSNVDQMLTEISRMNENVDPLIQWFETERLRMPPGRAEDTLERTHKLFSDLLTIASVYRRYESKEAESARAIALCLKCVPALREFRLASVQDEFQSLVSTLQELSRHSTKVGTNDWSQMLLGLNEALDRRDLIEVADQLEYVLIPALS